MNLTQAFTHYSATKTQLMLANKITIGTQRVIAESLSITKTIDSICDTFNFTLPNTEINHHEQVKILISETPILVGYINKKSHARPANNNTLSVSGRSISQDIIDSRITFSAADKTLAELCTTLFKKFNQNFTTKKITLPVKNFTITAESAFEALNQIAKQQDLLFIENADGSVALIKPADVDNSHYHLNETNLSNFRMDEDTSKSFATTTVKTNPTKDNLNPEHNNYTHSETTKGVRSTRVQEVINDKLTNQQACQDRAIEIIRLAKSQSITASGVSDGWRNPDGKIWRPNTLYTINSERMLLTSATFTENGSDRSTNLQFKGHYG